MTDKHCVSLELAKQLKEVGWGKETEFWWNAHDRIDKESNISYQDNFILENFNKWGNICGGYESIAAPLATEILEELPKNITIQNTRGDYWKLIYQSPLQVKEGLVHYETKVFEDIFCNALAKLYIYLKKEKLI
jgi:hypothetical protein